jgi:radical SAM superfamily enzyme YgiQ (UPF0313 family)
MAELDILYIHPAKHAADYRVTAANPLISPHALIPTGVPGMMNLALSHGLRVMGLNLFLETLLNGQFSLLRWLMRQPTPHLIAIDLHWYEHSFGAIDVARLCKRVHPTAPVVFGGLTASFFTREILEAHAAVDYIIRGDGEVPLASLSQALASPVPDLAAVPNLSYRGEGQVLDNPLAYCASTADLDALDFVSMNWLLHASEYALMQYNGVKLVRPGTSSDPVAPPNTTTPIEGGYLTGPAVGGHWLTIGRGCCFDCAYCGGGIKAHATLAGRQGIVPRSPGRIAEDIARLQAQGIRQVCLNLDPATMGRTFWSALCREMQARQVHVGIYNEFFQLPSIDMVDALTTLADPVHTQFIFSPLSGDEEVRLLNGKSFTNAPLLELLAHLANQGIPAFIYFSLNIPGETERTFRQTLRLAQEIADLYPPHLLQMLNMIHTVDPCSPMSLDQGEYDIDVQFRSFKDYYTYCRETAVWKPGMALDAWRGYHPRVKSTQPLEQMARTWDEFCQKQRAMCYPVPRGW